MERHGALLGTVLLVKHLLGKLENPSLEPQKLRKAGLGDMHVWSYRETGDRGRILSRMLVNLPGKGKADILDLKQSCPLSATLLS